MENSRSIKFKNFQLRLLSTIILLPIVLYMVWGGGFSYFVLLFIAACLAGYEWSDICGKWSFGIDGMSLITFVCLPLTAAYMKHLWLAFVILIIGTYLTFVLAKVRAKSENRNELIPSYLNRPVFYGIGTLYLGLTFIAFAFIHTLDAMNITTLFIFALVVCSDIFAYIFGSLIGGKKLAPKISPGKTWSGFISALICTFLAAYLFASILNIPNILDISIFGAVVVVVAHIGDLTESALKRYLQIKDTGTLIPGHGGILDRIDALSLVAIVTFVICLLMGKSILYI